MKRKIFGRISTLTALALIAAAVLFLAACGQRSSNSKSLSGGENPNPVVTGPLNIVLTTSSSTAVVSGSSGAGILLDAYVTAGGAPKTNLTTAGEDAQFTFSLGIGSIVGVTNLNNGHYTAKLTSEVIGTSTVTAVVGNYSSDSAPVAFTAGPVNSISILASKSTVAPDGIDKSELTITLKDSFGNNTDGTVTVASDLVGSTITPPGAIATSNGVATVDFKSTVSDVAHITATVTSVTPNITSNPPVSIAVYTSYLGVPDHIDAVVEPPEISVKETGGISVSKITISIYDYLNNLIDDSQVLNNVKVTILQGPNGGENIQGNIINQPVYLTSHGGVLEFALSAGRYPGAVTIEAEVLLDAEGKTLSPTVKQTIPLVYIRSGPPFSLVLQRENGIIDNNNGTLTHNYLGLVSDKWGNDITDGTGVYFGQIVNILLYKKKGTVSADGTTFTYAGIGDVLKEGDTVVITDMITALRGGFIVSSVTDSNTVVFASPVSTKEIKAGAPDAIDLVNADGSIDVEFYAGNNDRGGVFQGNLGGGMSTTTDGIAFGGNTYPGESDNCSVDEFGAPVRSAHVNQEVAIWAGTEDETVYDALNNPIKIRGIGDAEIFRLSWVAPTKLGFLGPAEGLIAGIPYDYSVYVSDSAIPTGYPIPFLPVGVSVSGGELWWAGSGETSATLVTDCEGKIYFSYAISAAEAQVAVGAGGTITVVKVKQ
ncbi:hypothetical protein EPN96_07210 [bacterium]|nr:MAG: hypothetical protein EPN96_07210 [bacterium]